MNQNRGGKTCTTLAQAFRAFGGHRVRKRYCHFQTSNSDLDPQKSARNTRNPPISTHSNLACTWTKKTSQLSVGPKDQNTPTKTTAIGRVRDELNYGRPPLIISEPRSSEKRTRTKRPKYSPEMLEPKRERLWECWNPGERGREKGGCRPAGVRRRRWYRLLVEWDKGESLCRKEDSNQKTKELTGNAGTRSRDGALGLFFSFSILF